MADNARIRVFLYETERYHVIYKWRYLCTIADWWAVLALAGETPQTDPYFLPGPFFTYSREKKSAISFLIAV